MKYFSRFFNSKKSNKGSALVTVVVIVAFISVLSTVLLYMSGYNYRTKISDVKTKQSFYGAEEVLEVMQTQLIQDVSVAASKTYSDKIADYALYAGVAKAIGSAGVGDDISDEINQMSEFQDKFNGSFRTYFAEAYNSRIKIDDGNINYEFIIGKFFPGAVYQGTETINGVVVPVFEYNNMTVYIEEFNYASSYDADHDVIGPIKIRAVSNGDKYTSIIKTEFRIAPPLVDVNFQKKGNFFADKMEASVYYINWEKL